MTASSSDTMSGSSALPIYSAQVELPLYLSPSYLAMPMEGVREQLNRSVLKYVEQLGGVLLSYTNLRLQRPLGRIAFDAPEIHIRVGFEATYFAPKVGDVIEGKVSRVGGDHIAILVLGVFNASVAQPAGWDPARPSVNPDDSAQFVVRSVHQANGLLTMHGELGTHGSGSGGALAATGLNGSGGDLGAKRKRHKEEKDESKRKKAAAAAETESEAGGKHKRSKEEKEAKKRRKAEKAAARDVE